MPPDLRDATLGLRIVDGIFRPADPVGSRRVRRRIRAGMKSAASRESAARRYRIEKYLTEGGMGAIYLGKKMGSGGFQKEVVLKQLLPEYTARPEFRDLFFREAKISATLDHANIVHTFDLVESDQSLFIVMEYVRGADLRTILRRARQRHRELSPAAAIHIALEILAGLGYAHTRRDRKGTSLDIIHRDVSPSNIICSAQGEAKLSDFGIAKASTHSSVFYRVRGKVGYMSPEQARSQPIDHRCDLYSLAVCLYESLSGERLFVGDLSTPADEIYGHPILPISRSAAGCRRRSTTVLAKALAPDIAERHQSAGELSDALRTVAHKTGLAFSAPELAAHLRDILGDNPERWLRDETTHAPAETHKVPPASIGLVGKEAASIGIVAPEDADPPIVLSPRAVTGSKDFDIDSMLSDEATRPGNVVGSGSGPVPRSEAATPRPRPQRSTVRLAASRVDAQLGTDSARHPASCVHPAAGACAVAVGRESVSRGAEARVPARRAPGAYAVARRRGRLHPQRVRRPPRSRLHRRGWRRAVICPGRRCAGCRFRRPWALLLRPLLRASPPPVRRFRLLLRRCRRRLRSAASLARSDRSSRMRRRRRPSRRLPAHRQLRHRRVAGGRAAAPTRRHAPRLGAGALIRARASALRLPVACRPGACLCATGAEPTGDDRFQRVGHASGEEVRTAALAGGDGAPGGARGRQRARPSRHPRPDRERRGRGRGGEHAAAPSHREAGPPRDQERPRCRRPPAPGSRRLPRAAPTAPGSADLPDSEPGEGAETGVGTMAQASRAKHHPASGGRAHGAKGGAGRRHAAGGHKKPVRRH